MSRPFGAAPTLDLLSVSSTRNVVFLSIASVTWPIACLSTLSMLSSWVEPEPEPESDPKSI